MLNEPSARITLGTPIASPGCCAICGKDRHPVGFAVTDNFDFEFYGTVYFCGDCVGEYARLFGYIAPEGYSDLVATIRDQDKELERLTSIVGAQGAIINGLTSITSSGSASVYDIGTGSTALDESDGSKDADESSNGGEGEQLPFDESASEQGRDDLHSDPGSDDLAKLLAL